MEASAPKKGRPHRSGRELWAILRHHVQHETFHITRLRNQDRSTSSATTVDDFSELEKKAPYETFTLQDCLWGLVLYLVVSVVAFSFVLEEWDIVDALHLAVVTLRSGSTDIMPTTVAGKMVRIILWCGGVAILAVALTVMGSQLVEAEAQAVEVAQEEIVRDVLRVFAPSKCNTSSRRPQLLKRSSSSFSHLTEETTTVQATTGSRWSALKKYWTQSSLFLWRQVPALLLMFGSAFLIGHVENWTHEETFLYMIGMGDEVPKNYSMKLFVVFFIPVSVATMGHFLGMIASSIIEKRRIEYDKKLWKQELTMEDLRLMSSSDSHVVSEIDFLIFMLVTMKKVDKELIDLIRGHFKELDLTHSGTLTRSDLELMAKKKLRSTQSKLKLYAYKVCEAFYSQEPSTSHSLQRSLTSHSENSTESSSS